jgi:hypothetical protein
MPWNLEGDNQKEGCLLSISKVRSIFFVLRLSWTVCVFDSSEVALVELGSGSRSESLTGGDGDSLHCLPVDGGRCGSSKGFTVYIFSFNAWYIALVPWKVLSYEVISRPSNPVFAMLR